MGNPHGGDAWQFAGKSNRTSSRKIYSVNFGAFVELLPGKDGMIHISKLANHRVEKVEDVVKIGDTLEVKVAEIDAQGRVNLVRNDLTYDNTAAAAPRRAEGFRARPPRRDGRN